MFKRKIVLFLVPALLIATLAYAYSRDWDNTNPIDHTLNSQWPAEIREVRVDIEERLDDIMDGFTSGDTATRFNRVPFYAQGADEAGVADTIVCYGKDVLGKTELHCVDEDDNVIQITSGGSLNVASTCSDIYPVGHIYISTVSTNPGTLLGCGTWAAWGAGKVIVGINAGDADFDTSEETGGSKTATISQANLPSYNLSLPASTGAGGGSTRPQNLGSQAADSTINVPSGGSGTAMSIVQPYIVAYLWERTS